MNQQFVKKLVGAVFFKVVAIIQSNTKATILVEGTDRKDMRSLIKQRFEMTRSQPGARLQTANLNRPYAVEFREGQAIILEEGRTYAAKAEMDQNGDNLWLYNVAPLTAYNAAFEKAMAERGKQNVQAKKEEKAKDKANSLHSQTVCIRLPGGAELFGETTRIVSEVVAGGDEAKILVAPGVEWFSVSKKPGSNKQVLNTMKRPSLEELPEANPMLVSAIKHSTHTKGVKADQSKVG